MKFSPILFRALDLRAERELRGISIEELAEETKYSVRQLEYFETGEFDKLPSDIFIRGMIRMFIDRLGLDPDMVHLEYLYHSERQHKREQNEKTTMFSKSLWPAQLGPVAGFFIFTSLIMLFLWPEKDLHTTEYLLKTDQLNNPSRVDWELARNSFDGWMDNSVTLVTKTGITDDITTLQVNDRGIRFETSEVNWIRLQDMRTGTEQLHGLFPGDIFVCPVKDETMIWFDRPEFITMRDLGSNKIIQTEISNVIRFLPAEKHSIIPEG